MVIMSANDVNPDENRDQSTSDASWYILDETGDTLLGTLPKHVLVSPTSEDVTVDLSSSVDNSQRLSDFEEAKEVLSTIENKPNLSGTLTDAKELLSSALLEDTVEEEEMKRRQRFVNTPDLTPGTRRKAKKRKRRTGTPLSMRTLSMQNQTTPRLGSGRQPNRPKKPKKSVILIDSDSEPNDSVIEITDEPSVIVLSDDEVGVCSGTVTKPTKQNKANKPNVVNQPNTVMEVVDHTGNYLPQKGDSSKGNAPSDKIQKNSELYQPTANQSETRTGLRPVIIDGCNVAFGHGRDRFSSMGLKICVDYFKKLGHEVRVFIPQFRKHHNATTEPQLLDEMEKDGTLCYTPSRRTDGKMIVSYDDRFIVQYADANGGVIVSRDNYRDLLNENPEWKDTINQRLLMYTWVGDTIMFPKDPLGRHGPTLQEFLHF